MTCSVLFPDKKYKVIYADPPWKYDNEHTGRNLDSGASDKYQVLSVEEICALPVQNIADKECVLFLWVTVPFLEDGFKVLKAWNFKYKTAIFWRKIMSLGMGYWFRGQVEVCLLGVRGNVKAFRSQRPNFIQSKIGHHSKKPYEMYGIIESLELGPKIELFARHKRVGWDAWGNQLPREIQSILGQTIL